MTVDWLSRVSSCKLKIRRQGEDSIRFRFKINHPYHGIQIDRAINMRKLFTFANAGLQDALSRRFPLQSGREKRGINHKEDKSAFSLVKVLSHRQYL